jgi:hypothetical protein
LQIRVWKIKLCKSAALSNHFPFDTIVSKPAIANQHEKEQNKHPAQMTGFRRDLKAKYNNNKDVKMISHEKGKAMAKAYWRKSEKAY